MTPTDTAARPRHRRNTLYWKRRDLTDLVHAASQGDERAWETLINRMSGAVWGALHRLRLDRDLRDDAYIATWDRLLRNIDSIREPERLAGWLATTATREAFDLIARQGRLVPVDDIGDRPGVHINDIDAGLLDGELITAALNALETLSDEEQTLIRMRILADTPATYAAIVADLGSCHGSIGPTLRRAINKIRRHPEVARLLA